MASGLSVNGGSASAWRIWALAGVAYLTGWILFGALIDTTSATNGQISSPTQRLLAVDAFTGHVGVALLLWGRSRPLLTSCLLAALTAVSVFVVAAAVVSLIRLATRHDHRSLVIVSLPWLAGNTVHELVVVPTLDPSRAASTVGQAIVWLTIAVMVFAVAVLAGWSVGLRREQLAAYQRQALMAAEIAAAREAQGRLAERHRIAHEMHDVLAHRLSLVALHSGALGRRTDLEPEAQAASAELVRHNAHEALEELRETLGALRADPTPVTAAQQPDITDLPALVEQASNSLQRVHLDVQDDVLTHASLLPAATGRHAYRIAQEALTNARKHASTSEVQVEVSGQPGHSLRLRVQNLLAQTGSAEVPRPPGARMGLPGMAERARVAGGHLTCGPSHGRFVVDAVLPWPPVGDPQ